MMARLHLLVEGQTEETFINSLLRAHLANFNVWVDVRCLSTKKKIRSRQNVGGILPFNKAKADLERWMKEDSNEDSWFSTMFDLYELPNSFPKFDDAKKKSDPLKRVKMLEEAFRDEINYRRFIPYIQLHEFESVLLSDPQKFRSEFIGQDNSINELIQMSEQATSPEHINDTPEGAPSKRIIQQIPEYEGRKASAGPLIAESIGLATIRNKCCHFGQWLTCLEGLAST
jgi:hypothetical protein